MHSRARAVEGSEDSEDARGNATFVVSLRESMTFAECARLRAQQRWKRASVFRADTLRLPMTAALRVPNRCPRDVRKCPNSSTWLKLDANERLASRLFNASTLQRFNFPSRTN